MDASEILADAFGRVVDDFTVALTGLDAAGLAFRPDPEANSIAWLAWHATRVHDDHVSELAGCEQVFIARRYSETLGFGFEPGDIGYGHTSEQVAAVRPDHPDDLLEYLGAVTDQTLGYLGGADAAELDRIVDRRWDPPVRAGVRLVSVINDSTQHAGQALYVRGLLDRRP